MDIKKLECPCCNADIYIEDGINTFYCQHCGSHLMLDGLSDSVIEARRMLELGGGLYGIKF